MASGPRGKSVLEKGSRIVSTIKGEIVVLEGGPSWFNHQEGSDSTRHAYGRKEEGQWGRYR
jgi:hypothetical protein